MIGSGYQGSTTQDAPAGPRVRIYELAKELGLPHKDVVAKVRHGFGPTLAAGEAELVGHWLGFDFRSSAAVQPLLGSGQLAPTARAHFFHYVESLASEGPVVIFLEDLH